MIINQTLFIIGAGGSTPYGFPTGRELSQLIINQFPDAYKQIILKANAIIRDKFDDLERELNSFINIFKGPDPSSIDIFISRNEEFSQIAKEAIIYCILKKENENRYVKHINQKMGNWYEYLFERMTENLTTRESGFTFTNNLTSFITFNYDRSLEQYFSTRLANRFFKGGNENISIMKEMLLYHVHGKVGEFIWESDQPHQFGHIPDITKMKELTKELRIVYDKSDLDDSLKQLITKSERIFFLGFGYSLENLRKIGIPLILQKGQQIIGTGLDLTAHEIELIKLKLKGSWVTNWHKDIIIENADCLQLLRNHL